jgi:hypothetical protein
MGFGISPWTRLFIIALAQSDARSEELAWLAKRVQNYFVTLPVYMKAS